MDASDCSIQVHNLQRKISVNVRALRQFANRALTASIQEPRPSSRGGLPHEIHVVLISDQRMSSLHRQFLNQSGPTDVITFQHGEIFISALMRELQLYIVHGLLHLDGFDDRSPAEQRSMRAAEARMLRRILV